MMWNQLFFQDAANNLMTHITLFHHTTLITVMMIMLYTTFFMASPYMTKLFYTPLPSSHHLETVWTFFPGLVLFTLAWPSLQLLYMMEVQPEPSVTLKITGHQWYWSYVYVDLMDLEFDSFMIPTSDLSESQFRLLEVDNRIILPVGVDSRLMLTSADVLHAWTIPAMAVKADAVPGRLSSMDLNPGKTGIYYGQCSEICGANHSFMPIAMEVISQSAWIKWAVSVSPPLEIENY